MNAEAREQGAGRRDDFDLQERLDSLMELSIWIAAGIGVGLALSVAIRAAGAHWSWALAGLVLLPIAFPASVLVVLATLIAIGVAAVCGFAWHKQDLERGGVEAEAARERRGPVAALRGARERQRWRAERVQSGRLALGENRFGTVRTVPFGARQGTRAFVVGAPGSGKSVDLALHAASYVARGQGCACIDPKRDRDLREALEVAAHESGRRLVLWSPEGPSTYNPVHRGTPSEITDKVLAGEEWSEPHYLRQAQRYLNLELGALRAAGQWPPTLGSLVRYLDPERLSQLAEGSEDGNGHVLEYLDSLSARQRQDLGGVRDRLAVLAESELGRYLAPRDGRPEIDLKSALEAGDVLYFELDADRFPLASQMLGAAIVSDLVALTGDMQGSPLRALIMIDEFAAIAAEEVSRLLSRSRSAGLSVMIATQAFADLSLARLGDSSESLRRQVLSHVDYLIAHRQSEPEAAELLGQMAGTRPAWSVAKRAASGLELWRSDEETTRRRTREFVRHPDEFKRLGVGEAIVIEPASARPAERVQVWPAEGGPGLGHRYPNTGRFPRRRARRGGTSFGQNAVSRD